MGNPSVTGGAVEETVTWLDAGGLPSVAVLSVTDSDVVVADGVVVGSTVVVGSIVVVGLTVVVDSTVVVGSTVVVAGDVVCACGLMMMVGIRVVLVGSGTGSVLVSAAVDVLKGGNVFSFTLLLEGQKVTAKKFPTKILV